ncbi:HepT-like ribonuclease domain-containing protein [Phaeodactylibacter xiamenensis]
MAFRHILVHDYYKVNTRIVWNAIENKLPEMKLEIEQMLEEE